ncbi:MAG: divalent-cation tolerance protein CutA [Thermoplasmata archaeon]|nr:MAG: divalent-cation tolerance protein CutA [Thermoplasmata archaeon]
MNCSVIYVTAKDEEEAKRIADHLLSKRLIACANMFPIKSLYWWKGEIESEGEIAMIMKTQESHKKSIISEIKTLHSYDVPCIEFFTINDGNPDYLKWIVSETS